MPKPALAEPDPRYWRRRANFRVRRERWSRTARYWLVILAIDASIGAALLQSGIRLAEQAHASQVFAVDRIQINGAERADPGTIRQSLARFLGSNVLDVNLHDVATVTRRNQWVLDAQAKRVLPGTVRVTVQERHPSAVAMIDGLAHVVDDTGHVVGPSGPGMADDLPVLTGLDATRDDSLIRGLQRGILVVERLRAHAPTWVANVAAIDLSRPDRITLRSVGPEPDILLDPANVERNVRNYLNLKEQIAEQAAGIAYVDLRWRDRINVMPTGGTSTKEDG